MERGDVINTPRFLKVTINCVLTRKEAAEQGFSEPTHYYDDPDYDILGKSTAVNYMIFAAVKKEGRK